MIKNRPINDPNTILTIKLGNNPWLIGGSYKGWRRKHEFHNDVFSPTNRTEKRNKFHRMALTQLAKVT